MRNGQMDEQSVSGVILAGGRATRMGGEDKGLVMLGDSPLVVRVHDRLAPQVERMMVNANRSVPRYRRLGFDVKRDVVTGYHGPLAGLLTGLTFSPTDWVVFTPCDTPWIPDDLVARLWAACEPGRAKIAVVHDGEQLQPLCCLLHRSLLGDIEQALQTDIRSMKGWLARHEYAVADYSDNPAAFTNLNYRSEVEHACRQYAF